MNHIVINFGRSFVQQVLQLRFSMIMCLVVSLELLQELLDNFGAHSFPRQRFTRINMVPNPDMDGKLASSICMTFVTFPLKWYAERGTESNRLVLC